ncbi:Metal tolerance 3 [Fusarium agapanthi]|uniref:Metal tolerance 3 n=1 Tax=Fusarium agapanthi TaxID=1803897 RepID=A0A9P5EEH0_9HYPO|nr:Metal tolerance 3 [Fusarium agapanthi]
MAEQTEKTTVQHDVDDPLGLSAHIKHESDMPGANTLRKRYLGLKKNHPLKEFYKTQNQSILAMLKSVEEHEQEVTDAHGANTLISLSLFITMADSVFDPMSGIMLYVAHRAVNKVDLNKYPSGRARISTAGNIVFSFIMFSVSLVLTVMSARDLAAGSEEETNKFHLPSVIAVTVAFATKLGLFFLCWKVDTVRAYYSGPRLVAEVDIVIDRNERVEVAHDVAEDLQIKLEKLPVIERAFVHIDYETSHALRNII